MQRPLSLLALLLVGLTLFALPACGGDNDLPEVDVPTEVPTDIDIDIETNGDDG